jgi:tape measure domain-containing protein
VAVKVEITFEMVDKISKDLDKLKTSVNKLGQSRLKRLTSAFSDIGNIITGVRNGLELASRAVRATTGFFAKFVNAAGKIEDITTQFKVLTGSIETAQVLVKELADFTARTPFRLEGVAAAAKTLLAFQFSQDEVLDRLQVLGDVAASTDKDIGALALIFGQVAAAGKLTGERFIQLAEAGANVGPAIAEQMGVAVEELEDLRSQGKITFEIFDKAFTSLTKEGGLFFGGMIEKSKTLSGVLSTLSDNVFLLSAEIGKELLPVVKGVALEINAFILQNEKLIKTKAIGFIADLADGFAKILDVVKALTPVWFVLGNGLEILTNALLKTIKAILQFLQVAARIPTLGVSNALSEGIGKAIEEVNVQLDFSNKKLKENTDNFVNIEAPLTKAAEKVRQFAKDIRAIPEEKEIEVKPKKGDDKKKDEPIFTKEQAKKFSGQISVGVSAVLSGDAKAGIVSIFNKSGNIWLQAVAGAIQIFGQSEEKFRKMINGLFTSSARLPAQMIRNLGPAFEELIRTLPESLTNFIQLFSGELFIGILDSMTRIFEDEDLIEKVGTAMAKGALDPRFINALIKAVGKMVAAFVTKGIPVLVNALIESMQQEIEGLFDFMRPAIDKFSSAVGSFGSIVNTLKGSITGGGGTAGNILSGGLGTVRNVLGFQEGGMVPQTGLAIVHKDENVTDKTLNTRMEGMLDAFERGDLGGPQTIIVKSVVGENEFAEAIHSLSKRGFRLDAA